MDSITHHKHSEGDKKMTTVKIAQIRATKKGRKLAHPTKGYAMGGDGKDGRKFYYVTRTVTETDRKVWACSCPAYKFGKGRPCKHLKQLWNGWLPTEDVKVYVGALEVLSATSKIVQNYWS
jgi:hypothetical protein